MRVLIFIISIVLFFISYKYESKNNVKSEKTNDSELNIDTFQTQKLKLEPDYIAPDGSEIFLLPSLKGGGMCICELSVDQTTQAVKHKTVEEIWFFLSGKGEVWRKIGDKEDVTQVSRDISVTIPLGCEFQFRNTGKEPLRFIIVTMPPWPGGNEATKVRNFWK